MDLTSSLDVTRINFLYLLNYSKHSSQHTPFFLNGLTDRFERTLLSECAGFHKFSIFKITMKRGCHPEWTWLDHRNATIPRHRNTLERLRRPSRFVPSSFVSSARREPVRADLQMVSFIPCLPSLLRFVSPWTSW